MNSIRSAKYYYFKSLRMLKRKGGIALLKSLLRKLKNLLLVTNAADWYCKDLRDEAFNIKVQEPVQIIFGLKDEIVNWLREHNISYPWMYIPEEIKTGVSDDHVFPHVKYNGEIIGYVKVGFKRVYILDYDESIQFPDKNSFIYDTFVMPEFRGKNIAPFLLNETIKYLKDHKFEKIWCHIPSWNDSSRRAFEKLNFQRIAHVRYFKILNYKFFSKNPTKILLR